MLRLNSFVVGTSRSSISNHLDIKPEITLLSSNRVSPAELRTDPIWQPLRAHPGFEKLAAQESVS